jgi:hypothetical protein
MIVLNDLVSSSITPALGACEEEEEEPEGSAEKLVRRLT